MYDHSTRALEQRLDDHRSNLGMFFFEQPIEFVRAIDPAGCASLAHRTPITVSRLHAVDRKQKSPKRAGEIGLRSDRHRTYRVAVICMIECNKRRLLGPPEVPPILYRHLERDFDCRRAVIGKEDMHKIRRQDLSEGIAQIFDRIVSESS